MNAQQLINETPVNHFDWKVFWKPQSLSKHTNDDRGDKFVARKGNNQYTSLKPRTSDLLSKVANKINNIKNTQTAKADVFRELGIEVL